jgi:hypothetical protein
VFKPSNKKLHLKNLLENTVACQVGQPLNSQGKKYGKYSLQIPQFKHIHINMKLFRRGGGREAIHWDVMLR